MEWAQTLTIVAANITLILVSSGLAVTLFLWSRKEANDFHRQTLNLINSIQQEMKDFHGRLCAIEERRNQ